VPTQVVSNEEFVPPRQSQKQKQVEQLIGQLGTEKARRLGVPRREFMASGMGMATAFWAMNQVYGNHWMVDEDETHELGAYEEKWPKGEYFVFDVQTHFTNGIAIGFRNHEFVKNMGFKLDDSPESYSFPNFVKEMYFDSETSMLVISGVPGRERHVDKDGNPLEGPRRGGGILPSWLMSERKRDINEMAGGQRALCQGNCAPNHYWNRDDNKPDTAALHDQMEIEVNDYGIDSWKWYCHTDPGRSGSGFKLDDERLTYPFYEKSRELGLKVFSIHKGFSYQSRTLGHLANPADVEKAALDNPDLTFVIYHSAMQHSPTDEAFGADFNPETGEFGWHDVLIDIKRRNPQIDNVYPEIGTTFGTLAIYNPLMCQHLIGRNVKYYGADHVIWGTDCLWWGSPQWVIEAFKRFQIQDELCDKFGYAKLTHEDKAKIFGLNAAKIYDIDAAERRRLISADALSKLETEYHQTGGTRENAAYGWVRDDTAV
jgi:hypothetical protein